MTNTVQLKRSNVPNSVPGSGNLVPGELAINYADGNLFYKNTSNVVTVIASNKFLSVSGNVTGGNIISLGTVSSTGKISAGAVAYTNVDGLDGQVLATYGNGTTYWRTASSAGGGFVGVILRSGNTMFVPITLGNMVIIGRTGNISIPVTG